MWGLHWLQYNFNNQSANQFIIISKFVLKNIIFCTAQGTVPFLHNLVARNLLPYIILNMAVNS